MEIEDKIRILGLTGKLVFSVYANKDFICCGNTTADWINHSHSVLTIVRTNEYSLRELGNGKYILRTW